MMKYNDNMINVRKTVRKGGIVALQPENPTLAHKELVAVLTRRGLLTREIAELALMRLADVVTELMQQGYGVKINDLGIFKPTVRTGGQRIECHPTFLPSRKMLREMKKVKVNIKPSLYYNEGLADELEPPD